MARTSNPSDHPAVPLHQLYNIWRRQRKTLGLSCSPRLAKKAWRISQRNKKAKHRVRSRRASETPDVIEPSHRLDGDEGSAYNVGSSSQVTPEEQFFDFSLGEFESLSGFSEPLSTGPSTPDLVTAAGPSQVLHVHHPHIPATEFPDPGPSSTVREPYAPTAIEEYQIPHPSSTPFPAPIPSHPLSAVHFFQNILRGEEVYRFLSAPEPAVDCLDLYPQTEPLTVPPITDELDFSAYFATTSTAGFNSTDSSSTSWYTPAVITQNLPAQPDDDRFVFYSADPTVQDQPVWNTSPDSEYTPFSQTTFAPHALAVPPPPPPPAPVVMRQSDDSVDKQWRDIAQILESDWPQATAPLPASHESAEFAPIQQTLDALDSIGCGKDFKTLHQRLVKVERLVLSFAPA